MSTKTKVNLAKTYGEMEEQILSRENARREQILSARAVVDDLEDAVEVAQDTLYAAEGRAADWEAEPVPGELTAARETFEIAQLRLAKARSMAHPKAKGRNTNADHARYLAGIFSEVLGVPSVGTFADYRPVDLPAYVVVTTHSTDVGGTLLEVHHTCPAIHRKLDEAWVTDILRAYEVPFDTSANGVEMFGGRLRIHLSGGVWVDGKYTYRPLSEEEQKAQQLEEQRQAMADQLSLARERDVDAQIAASNRAYNDAHLRSLMSGGR